MGVPTGPARAETASLRRAATTVSPAAGWSVYSYSQATDVVFSSGTGKTSAWQAGTFEGSAVDASGQLVPVGGWWDAAWKARRCAKLTSPLPVGVSDPLADLVVPLLGPTGPVPFGSLRAVADDGRLLASRVVSADSLQAVMRVQLRGTLAPGGSTGLCVYLDNPAPAAPAPPAPLRAPLYRINAAGPQITTTDDTQLDWAADDDPPSPFLTGTAIRTAPVGVVFMNHPSMPPGIPPALMQTLRAGRGVFTHEPVVYRFPLAAGTTAQARGFFLTTLGLLCVPLLQSTAMEFTVGTAAPVTVDPYRTTGSCNRAVSVAVGTDVPASGEDAGFLTVQVTTVRGSTPLIGALQIDGVAPLTVSLGDLEARAAHGQWTSATVDTAPGAGIYGLTTALAGTDGGLAGATWQIATSANPAGPWSFTGPDGSTGTFYGGSFNGFPVAFLADGRRYLRVRVSLSTLAGHRPPAVARLSVGTHLRIPDRTSGEPARYPARFAPLPATTGFAARLTTTSAVLNTATADIRTLAPTPPGSLALCHDCTTGTPAATGFPFNRRRPLSLAVTTRPTTPGAAAPALLHVDATRTLAAELPITVPSP
ncbi:MULTISPECIES: hypothetical protein [unclassified Streptomyces]|uniref:hypothetical protein n=1 Tax=unclassified Streptomyces TaxID=2593676 RepID=UPI000DC7822E|nr:MULTISPECIES: hypothetical protein [unclassified Streptomyces]AWZ05273.1 hypothetical protein DRB89_12075 [Streptomyces sp. ICC4]AWZ12787.1 hypothetical protein DRB96_11110 [Streptomyces sp. ICC1]